MAAVTLTAACSDPGNDSDSQVRIFLSTTTTSIGPTAAEVPLVIDVRGEPGEFSVALRVSPSLAFANAPGECDPVASGDGTTGGTSGGASAEEDDHLYVLTRDEFVERTDTLSPSQGDEHAVTSTRWIHTSRLDADAGESTITLLANVFEGRCSGSGQPLASNTLTLQRTVDEGTSSGGDDPSSSDSSASTETDEGPTTGSVTTSASDDPTTEMTTGTSGSTGTT